MGNESSNVEMHCSDTEDGDGITCKLTLEENNKKATCTATFQDENEGSGFGMKLGCTGDKDLMKKLEQRAQNMTPNI